MQEMDSQKTVAFVDSIWSNLTPTGHWAEEFLHMIPMYSKIILTSTKCVHW